MSVQKIGPYELTNLLGEGAFGRVWAALDTRLGRKVAIKTLRSEVKGDRDTVTRFQSEARILAGLNHPNITMLLDIYEQDGSEMMIMEFVPGETLEKILGKCKKLDLSEALAVMFQAIAGLGHAHKAGLTHRDIKLANLMVSETGTLKIMDFGLARVQGSLRQTKVGLAMGTPHYLSPEQCRGGEGDGRSDQYSLAVVLFELLVGQPPFVAENDFDLMRAHLESPPPSIRKIMPKIPKNIDAAIIRALSKNPADRFDSIDSFGAALNAASVSMDASNLLLRLLKRPITGGQDVIMEASSKPDDEPVLPSLGPDTAGVPGRKNKILSNGKLLALILCLTVLGSGVIGLYWWDMNTASAMIALPAPPEQAQLRGTITSVISGNAISVNSETANLYGVVDRAQSAEEVLDAQARLKKVLPKSVLCYSKIGHKYECYDSEKPHKNIALIAIELGVVKAKKDVPENIYRDAEQLVRLNRSAE